MSMSWLVGGLGRLAVWDLDRVPLSKNPFHTSKGIQSESKPPSPKPPINQLVEPHPLEQKSSLGFDSDDSNEPKKDAPKKDARLEHLGWLARTTRLNSKSLPRFIVDVIFEDLFSSPKNLRLKKLRYLLTYSPWYSPCLFCAIFPKKNTQKHHIWRKKTNLVAKFRRVPGKDSKRSNFGTVTPWNCGARTPVVPKKQGSLYDTGPQTMHCYSRDIPQNCHRFLFFISPKIGSYLMTPWKTKTCVRSAYLIHPPFYTTGCSICPRFLKAHLLWHTQHVLEIFCNLNFRRNLGPTWPMDGLSQVFVGSWSQIEIPKKKKRLQSQPQGRIQ